jgi:PAS domain S-box-containing protein
MTSSAFDERSDETDEGFVADITERTRAEQALRESQAQLAAEAEAWAQLHHLSARLWQMRSLPEGLEELLAATITMLGADMGTIQLLDHQCGVLRIVAQRGFTQDFLDCFRDVSAQDDSTCGRALRLGARIVVDDIETEASCAPMQPMLRAAGFRAVQSTPLIGRDGTPLGILSTYFKPVHRPSEHELRRLDVYVRQGVDFIERSHTDAALRDSEARYRRLVALLPVAVYSCAAPSGVITFYNEQAATLWGRTPTVGDTDERFCGAFRLWWPDGSFLAYDQTPMALTLREGTECRNREAVIERPDGSRIPVLVNTSPVCDANGRVVSAINVFYDITERKRTDTASAMLAAIVASSDDAIISKSLEGVITSWNQSAERLFGYTAAEAVGQPITLLIPPERLDEEPQILARLQRGERVEHFETVRLRKDGSRVDLSLTISPVKDAAGRIIGASKVARDITERKRAEAALRELNATLEQRVVERTALLTLIQDVTRAANEAPESPVALQDTVDRLCAYTGWPIGHVYLAVAPGADRWAPTAIWHLDAPERFRAFQQATQGLEYAPGEGLIGRVGARGQPEWQRAVGTDPTCPRRHAAQEAGLRTGVAWPLLVGNEVAGVLEFYATESLAPNAALLAAMTQIGTQLGRVVERERAVAQAQRQQETLLQQEKLAAMSTMLASVAHELNNPLATILLQAELVGEDVRGGPLAEPVTEIVQAAARCERLVRQFLTLARQHPPERTAVALNTLVAETVELLAYAFRVDNVAVHLHLDEHLPLLWGDPHQLQQVLLNLLSNAQQALHAAPGAREVTCTTQYDPAQHQIRLAVADTGPGIPLPLQGRIFEPFFTTKPPGVGTGLGLPLCQGIVAAHGGTLEVTSALGAGATFQLTLPVGAMPVPRPAAPGAAAGHAVRGGTILVVEDERSLASGLARLLSRDGHTVDTVANGRLALAKLDERAYDCILCDVRMPELDGPSLYRLLERQHPHLCRRCIFLTGDTLEPATQAFLEQSGAPCLAKPFTIAEARRIIRRVLYPGSPAAPASAPPAA